MSATPPTADPSSSDGPAHHVGPVRRHVGRAMTTSPGAVRTRFAGTVYCHAPVGEPFDVDVLARPADPSHRWDVAGARTAYLASSPAVALAEFARHAGDAADRVLVALDVAELEVLDVRGVPQPTTFLDRSAARRLALTARQSGVSGLLVPSAAFLDRPRDAFNIVLFCDRIPGGVAGVVGGARQVGRVCLEPGV